MIQIPIIFEEKRSGLQSFNCYVTENDGKLVLIDGGIAHETFQKYATNTLHTYGYDWQDIDEIYLTHHHEDHVGLVKHILQQKDVPVYIHPEAKPRLTFDGDFLQMRIAFFENFYRKMDCLDDARTRLQKMQHTYENRHTLRIDANYQIVEDGAQLGRFNIVGLPGHSTDSIGFYDAVRAEIYAGDVVLKQTSTNAIIDPLSNGEYVHANWQQRASLTKLLNMPIETIYAGHQPIITDPQAVITAKLAKLDQKAAKLKQLLTQPMTAKEAAQAFYGLLYTKQFSLVLSEIVGQLQTLQRMNHIKIVEKQGIYYFSAKD
jgi:glyoxylase-like metal-dependent hydrolase (beta-lactamase superfamily II)